MADVQYSSSGVREQTAELSSSFLSDSDLAKRFEPTFTDADTTSLAIPRRPEPITETSEPASPDDREPGPRGSGSGSAISAAHDALLMYSEDESDRSPGSRFRQRLATGSVPEVVITNEEAGNMNETTPLLPRERLSSYRKTPIHAPKDLEEQQPVRKRGIWNRLGHHFPSLTSAQHVAQTLSNPKAWDVRQIAQAAVVRPVTMLPAVFLGLLLNLLDALSYGIILFPLGEDVFSSMGADGVSMFYVSCIISQIVYSSGSIFRGGVGSEMVSSADVSLMSFVDLLTQV